MKLPESFYISLTDRLSTHLHGRSAETLGQWALGRYAGPADDTFSAFSNIHTASSEWPRHWIEAHASIPHLLCPKVEVRKKNYEYLVVEASEIDSVWYSY